MWDNSGRTIRQQMLELLAKQPYSARSLAESLGISVREVEGHLPHVVKTVGRQAGHDFLLIPSQCQNCRFIFKQRTRLTPPTRCPQCRSEFISPPRFHIAQKT